MKIVFLSNYYNHHQSTLSENFFLLTEGKYWFIGTEPMDEERKNMGWDSNDKPSFVYQYQDNIKLCDDLILNADLVIYGSAPYKLVKQRLKSGKIIFKYSERIYKKGYEIWKWPYRFIKQFIQLGLYGNIYLLCASAYSTFDYNSLGLFNNKTYKWGYFPLVKEYDSIETLVENKTQCSILWCSRFIDLKHPENVLLVAEKLKEEGYNFNITMIGVGPLKLSIEKSVTEKQLTDYVKIIGAMSPDKVREYMEQSQIYLFTSDFNEGWGAVLNESMNSGCAVVASHAIGSVPFLIEDKVNGLIYQNDDIEDLYYKVKWLLDNPEQCKRLGVNAYHTMVDNWNAKVAAERVIRLSQAILNGNKHPDLYEDGPGSKAYRIKNNWYKNGQ